MIRTKINGIYFSFIGYSIEDIKYVYGVKKIVEVSIDEFIKAVNKVIMINTLDTRFV